MVLETGWCYPEMSGRKPITMGSATVHHVGEGSLCFVSGSLIIALCTDVCTRSVCTEIFTGRSGSRRLSTSAKRRISSATTSRPLVVAVAIFVTGVLGEHARHHFLHLRENVLFASLKVLLATLHTVRHSGKLVGEDGLIRIGSNRLLHRRECCDGADRCGVRTWRWCIEVLNMVMGEVCLFLEQALGDHVGDGREVGLLWVRKHGTGHRERDEVILCFTEVSFHIGPSLVGHFFLCQARRSWRIMG